jgi:hypothetical protein
MMLREMQAFQACWMDLKDDYPTSREDNTLIAQAMGQLVDRYQKPEDIENSLPEYLQPLFRRLAVAYFQGYEPRPRDHSDAVDASGAASGQQVGQQREIVAAVNKMQWLAQRARHENQQARKTDGLTFSEMETLIIEIPEHWRSEDES